MEITVIPKKDPVKIDTQTGKLIKLRVAAYARVSTDLEDQKNSFELQKEEFESRIKQNPDWEFVKMYADRGISGTQIKHRVQFQKMIADAKNGKIDLILTKSISRFARNTVDLLSTVRELVSIGVGVFFEKENITTTKDNVDLVLTLYASLAESESRSISENVKWGVRKRMSKNERKVPVNKMIGYSQDSRGNWYINEDGVLIHNIFTYFIQGYSYRQIAEKIKAEDKDEKRKWDVAKIHRILHNEKYKGTVIHQKTVVIDVLTHKQVKNDGIEPQYIVSGHHPGIISEEDFDYVQMVLKNKALAFGQYSTSRTSEFSRLVVCEECGRNLSKIKYAHNNEYYLTCKNRLKTDEDYVKCKSEVIPYSLLQLATYDILDKVKKEADVSLGFTMAMIDEFSKNAFVKELHDIDQKIIDVEKEIKELVKLQINNDSIEEYETNFNKLKAKRNILAKEKSKLIELAKNNHELQRKYTQITDFLKNDNIRDTADIDVFIGKILHRKDGSLRFGIKGDGFEKLSHEEIINQLKTNESVYSSFKTNNLGSLNYEMVILGGRVNA